VALAVIAVAVLVGFVTEELPFLTLPFSPCTFFLLPVKTIAIK
jgi:hypothetical protein